MVQKTKFVYDDNTQHSEISEFKLHHYCDVKSTHGYVPVLPGYDRVVVELVLDFLENDCLKLRSTVGSPDLLMQCWSFLTSLQLKDEYIGDAKLHFS